MNDADKKKFSELMAGLGETFQKTFTKPALRIYWEILKQFSFANVEQAVFKLLASRTITGTIPVPAEIINAMPKAENSLPSAAEVWDMIIRAAEAGRDTPGRIPEAAVRALSVVGGFRQLALTSYESLRFAYPKFQAAYESLSESGGYLDPPGDYLPDGDDLRQIGWTGQ